MASMLNAQRTKPSRSKVGGPWLGAQKGPAHLQLLWYFIIQDTSVKVQLFVKILYYNLVLSSIEFSKTSDGPFLLSVSTLVFRRLCITRPQHICYPQNWHIRPPQIGTFGLPKEHIRPPQIDTLGPQWKFFCRIKTYKYKSVSGCVCSWRTWWWPT